MAKINTCRLCGKDVTGSTFHPECRIAFLEAVMYELNRLIREDPYGKLPQELVDRIRSYEGKSLETSKKEMIEKEAKKFRK